MVTPINSNGRIDLAATEHITEFIIKNGTTSFVLGTTGESVSIADEHRLPFVETYVKTTNGRTMTYAGIPSNCFQNVVHFAKQYFDVGVDAVVVHLPNFYPLTDDHMLRYYESLADACPGPVILYNMPKTTHHSIPLDVIDQLSQHPNIAGLKDSETDLPRLEKAVSLWKDRDDFSILIGWAAQSAKGLALGADGIVPSAGNFIPAMFCSLYNAALKGDSETAIYYQKKIDEISQIYQKDKILSESIPALKIIMNYLGLCEPYVLPPLMEPSQTVRQEILKQIKINGIMEYGP